MKITDVEVVRLSKDLGRSYRNAKEARSTRVVSLVRLETDDGLSGLGQIGCRATAAEAMVLGRLRDCVIGQSPFDVELIWSRVFDGSALYDPAGSMVAAMSGVDIACWDIMGKALDLPVCRLLGGACHPALDAYASDLHWQEDPAAMARAAAGLVEQGYRYVKTHLGVDVASDVGRVEAIRAAIGPEAGLMVDVNTAFSRSDAIRFGKRIAEYDIRWYEEPLSPMDLAGLELVRDSTRLEIAFGENVYTRWGFRDVVEHGGVSILMPDVTRAGGLTEMRKIAAIADAWGLEISPHNYGSGVCAAATVQFMAACPRIGLLEWDPLGTTFLDELLVAPFEISGGSVMVPETPGLGVQLTSEVRAMYGA